MKFKFPNYLTIGRIIIVPVFVFAFYLPGFYGDVIPFALFVIAIFFACCLKSYQCCCYCHYSCVMNNSAIIRNFAHNN